MNRTRRHLAWLAAGLAALPWATALGAGGDGAARNTPPALPRWEAGLSLAGLYAPDYRGSDQSRGYALPLPYFVYRGERLRADRDGVRAEVIETDRVELNVSFGLGLPVRASRNDARRGMEELDWVVEAGPALNVKLARWEGGRNDLTLRLPVRAAFAVDGGLDSIGYVFTPSVRATWRGVPWAGEALLRLSTGPSFATRDYHRFYYGVAPQFATAARPAYEAGGGYSGWELSGSAVRIAGSFRLFAFAGADFVHGAAYEDSPLVRQKTNYSVGIGFAYVLARSSHPAGYSD